MLLSAKQTALWMNRRNAVRVAFFHSTLLNTAIGSAEVPFPHLRKDVRQLEADLWGAMRISRCLDNRNYKEKLREHWLLSLKKREHGNTLRIYKMHS